VPALDGGVWCLTVRLKQGWKPFAWTVCHKTNDLAGRAGEASKLDFAILQAEAAMIDLENASTPADTAKTPFEKVGWLDVMG